MFSKTELILKRQKAMRKRLWFKVLNQSERAIFNLTIQCVERIKSSKLANIMTAIMEKLTNSMASKIEKLSQNVGRKLAQKISSLALSWGNPRAQKWAQDTSFARYLTIITINAPTTFGISGNG